MYRSTIIYVINNYCVLSHYQRKLFFWPNSCNKHELCSHHLESLTRHTHTHTHTHTIPYHTIPYHTCAEKSIYTHTHTHTHTHTIHTIHTHNIHTHTHTHTRNHRILHNWVDLLFTEVLPGAIWHWLTARRAFWIQHSYEGLGAYAYIIYIIGC